MLTKPIFKIVAFFTLISSLLISMMVAAAHAEPTFPSNYYLDSPSQRWTGETRFGVNVRLKDLKLNVPVTTLKRDDDVYYVESQAIIDAPAEKVFAVSTEYNNYKQFAPYVLESQIVGRTQYPGQELPSDLYIWTKMRYVASYMGIDKTITSMYYLRSQPLKGVLDSSDFAIRWKIEKPHQGWKNPTNSYFSVLDGSWYILPLEGNRTYVRYFLKVNEDTPYPTFIVKRALGGPLKSGVQKLIEAITKRAKNYRSLSEGPVHRSP